MLPYKFGLIFIGMKQKKIKMADSKKTSFQPPPKTEQLSPKFYKLIIGWVGLIDVKGIHFAQPIWFSGSRMYALFTPKNTKNAFLAVNWAYNEQPDDHIGWAKWMPFASIIPTYPMTNLWNFGDNRSAFGGGWNNFKKRNLCFISI